MWGRRWTFPGGLDFGGRLGYEKGGGGGGGGHADLHCGDGGGGGGHADLHCGDGGGGTNDEAHPGGGGSCLP
jgi:hypothetical protein